MEFYRFSLEIKGKSMKIKGFGLFFKQVPRLGEPKIKGNPLKISGKKLRKAIDLKNFLKIRLARGQPNPGQPGPTWPGPTWPWLAWVRLASADEKSNENQRKHTKN